MTTIKGNCGFRSCRWLLVIGMALALVSAFGPSTARAVEFLETFTYSPDGDLNGRVHPPSGNTWVGGLVGEIEISGEAQAMLSEPAGTSTAAFSTLQFPDVAPAADNIINVKANIAKISSINSNFTWKLFFYNVTGSVTTLLAEWDGSFNHARPRHEGADSCAGTCLGTNQLGTQNGANSLMTGGGVYDEISAEINVVTGIVDYYFTPNGGTKTYVNTMKDTRIPGKTVNQVVIQRQARATDAQGNMFFDNLSAFPTPGLCAMVVTPLPSAFITDNFLSVAEPSGAGFPSSFSFAAVNQSSTTNTLTAAEVKADGTATDYPWLSLSGPIPASVGPGGTATVEASVTPGAAPGIYAGNIQISDASSCSPANNAIRPIVLTVGSAPCFVDPFQYKSGNLSGNGGWNGGSGLILTAADPDNADNQVVRIDLVPNLAGTATISGMNCPPCEDGTFTFVARVKGSAAGTAATGAWVIDVYDNSSQINNLARFEGDFSRVRGRTAGAGIVTDYSTIDTSYHEIKALIDVKNNRTTYYFDGVQMTGANPQTHGADLLNGRVNVGDRINSISLLLQNRTPLSGYIVIDDVQIISCPGDCLGRVSPDLSQNDFTALAHAKSGATTATLNDDVTVYGTDYTFHNEGPASISYTVQEVNASGAPTDHAWMALSKSGAGPLTGGTSDTPVTITYDTTGLADGLYRGYIKFTDDCNPDRTYTRAVQLNVGQCIADDFAYPDGNLESMPGWRTGFLNQLATVPQRPGGTSPFPIEVVGGKVVVRGKPAPGTVEATHQRFDHCSVCPDLDTETPGLQGDGLVVVRARIKGTVGGGGSRFWNLEFTNNMGQILASWRGAATFAEGHSNAALTSSLTDGLYHDLRAVVNPNDIEVEGIPANTTKYFFDGALMGSGLASHASPAADRIVLIRIRRDNNANADADPTIEIDDIHVSDCGPICGDPVFDVRGATPVDLVRDGRVTDKDLAIFEACGDFPAPAVPNPSLSKECKCMDLDNNDIIDLRDYARFQRCYSGTNAADPACDN